MQKKDGLTFRDDVMGEKEKERWVLDWSIEREDKVDKYKSRERSVIKKKRMK